MSEVTAAGIGLGIPVVGQFDGWRTALPGNSNVLGGGQEHQRETAGGIVEPGNLLEAQLGAVEVERLIEVAHAHHGVQKFHLGFSGVSATAI